VQDFYLTVDIPGKFLERSDLLYCLALLENSEDFTWFPGHVGLYLGTENTTDDIINDGSTIIESVPGGVRIGDLQSDFINPYYHIYLGPRRYDGEISELERLSIAELALNQNNKGYWLLGQGNWGDNKFSCVGLTEYCYDQNDLSIVPTLVEIPFLYPYDQYKRTDPVREITIKSGEELDIKVFGVVWDNDKTYAQTRDGVGYLSDIPSSIEWTDGSSYNGKEFKEFKWTPQQADVGSTYNVTFKVSVGEAGNIYSRSQSVEILVEQGETLSQGSIQGIVSDAITLSGIDNVNVGAYQNQQLIGSVQTSSDGSYLLELPVGEEYRISFTKDSYLPVEYHNINIEDDITTYLETVLQIDESYNGFGNIEGVVSNASNGQPISNVNLLLRKGMNVKTGTILATANSSYNGSYRFNNISAGNYTIEVAKDGYITSYFSVVCIGNQTTSNQNVSITQDLLNDEIRIVLEWGATPRDLDSHLTGPIPNSSSRFHIFYGFKNYYFDNELYSNLDYDDVSSYGPETITINVQTSGTYRYSVHDYTNRYSSNSNALALSSAKVKVYQGANLLNTFNVPNTDGTLWTVFEIDGNRISPINSMSYESSSYRSRTLKSTANNNDAHLLINLPEKEY
jgi:hypothetical protein